MSKKKAIKVLGATAIAASALAVSAPTQAASNVDALVKKAVDAGTVLKWAISVEGSADGTTRPYAQYNAAKDALKAAKAAVASLPKAEKEAKLAQLDKDVQTHITRTMHYIDAITAGEKMEAKQAVVEAQIEKGLIDDATETAYHELSTEIRKQAVLLDRVYGKSTRDAIRDQYKEAAQDVRDSVKYAVTVKIELDLANEALEADKMDEFDKHLAEANKYIGEVENAEMKETLAAAIEELEAGLNPAVKSVNAVNGKEIVVVFNKAVNKTEAEKIANYSVEGVELTKAVLSEDGKIVTLTPKASLNVNNAKLTVKAIATKADTKVRTKAYTTLLTFKDTKAPTVVSTQQTTASTYKVTFSEPIQSLGTVSYKFADGKAAAVTNDFTAGTKEVTFTLDSGIEAGKVVTASFVGAQDAAGNLLSPNPASVTFTKGAKDGVAPTVSSVTQTGAKELAVQFSEELVANPTITVNNATTTLEQDKEDKTMYVVKTTSVLEGATTVAVAANYTDLSGEKGAAFSKVYTFVKDAVAPKVASSDVVVDANDRKEYLEITFDKNVVLSTPTVDVTGGTSTKDFVTTTIANADITAKTVAYKDANNKKVVRVDLDTLLGGKDVKGASYSLNLAFSGISSEAGVAINTAKTTFTRGEDGVPASSTVLAAPTIAPVVDNNNKVNVTFATAVDGASATNVANYNIDGAVVESVTLNPIAEDGKQVAVLTLEANSNTFSGVRNISVENVKALGSTKTMVPFSTTIDLNENVAPTITDAKLTDTNKVKLTFSEAVTNAVGDTNDFVLNIGGVKVVANDVITTAAQTTAATTIELTLEDDVTAADLAKGLTIKALNTIDVQDNAGNDVVVSTPVTVVQ